MINGNAVILEAVLIDSGIDFPANADVLLKRHILLIVYKTKGEGLVNY